MTSNAGGAAMAAANSASAPPLSQLPLRINTMDAAKLYAATVFPGAKVMKERFATELGSNDPRAASSGILQLDMAEHQYAHWPRLIDNVMHKIVVTSEKQEKAVQIIGKRDGPKRVFYETVQFTDAPCICRSLFGGDKKLSLYTTAPWPG